MKLHINFKGNRESVKSAETNTAGKNWDLNLDLEFEPDEVVAASKLCKDAYHSIISDILPLMEADHKFKLEEMCYKYELMHNEHREKYQE